MGTSRYNNKSIALGKHLRHARDHYSLLLESLNSKPIVLSYDKRQRDRPMETSRVAAIEAFEETIRAMEHLSDNPVDIDTELTLNAVTPFPQTLKSAVGREVCSLLHSARFQILY